MQRVHIFSALGLGDRAAAATADLAAHVPGVRVSVDIPAEPSRRRRLWELDAGAHCPVVGVCLPLPELRRMAARLLPQERYDSDYALHGAIVGASRSRTPVAEALQRDLERRFALAVQRAQKVQDREGLASWWQRHMEGGELAGALWATLTHPRCDPGLAQRVIGQVHMLQHQVGSRARVDAARVASAITEKAEMTRELADVQARLHRVSADAAQRIQWLEGELMRLRAAVIGRDSLLAQQREELEQLRAGTAGRQQAELAQEVERLRRRAGELEGALEASRSELAGARSRGERPMKTQRPPPPGTHVASPPQRPWDLGNRAVLCVGGRPSCVPLYRTAVERAGARFLHHDGDDADKASRLEEVIRAADLVICQTGCISHGAYWQVKDQCKRTGKPCLFVDTPSRTALERALSEAATKLMPAPAAQPAVKAAAGEPE